MFSTRVLNIFYCVYMRFLSYFLGLLMRNSAI